MRFSPRIRDLKDQKLYRTKKVDLDEYPMLKEHIQGTINQQLILDDWDEMLRLVGSLKMGWGDASHLTVLRTALDADASAPR